MALNPSGAISLAGPTAGQSIAVELGLSPTASISLNDTNVRTLAGVPSGAIIMPTNFWGKSNGTQRAIFGFGFTPAMQNVTNLVSNTGVVASNTPGVGTARAGLAAANYGGDKAIFGFGATPTRVGMTNLVSNTGVVASDTAAVGTARYYVAATGYGSSGQAIFGFGRTGPISGTRVTNLVSNTGVVASDIVGTAPEFGPKSGLAGARYGGDKAIFAYGDRPQGGPTPVNYIPQNNQNLVSNTGVVAAEIPGVGTARTRSGAAGYGGDKAIFGFGATVPITNAVSMTNLVSNTGVVASDTPGVGSAKRQLGAAGYGGDKAIFGFGSTPVPASITNITNLVSNTGVVASDTPGVGTSRTEIACAGYSFT